NYSPLSENIFFSSKAYRKCLYHYLMCLQRKGTMKFLKLRIILQKRNKKNPTKSETESDAESIISDEEEERNSILMSSNKKKSKPWNETIIREKYDVFITNDHERTEELIPPLSVYIGAGFAAEIKHFHVVLLAEVFENFRTLSMNYFELDPVHFYTTPSLTWSAGIKTTNVTLELLTDIDMYLMLESGIRGGNYGKRSVRSFSAITLNLNVRRPTLQMHYHESFEI
ncbi:vesicular glutamate transporter 2, partial [Caerostris darwini]